MANVRWQQAAVPGCPESASAGSATDGVASIARSGYERLGRAEKLRAHVADKVQRAAHDEQAPRVARRCQCQRRGPRPDLRLPRAPGPKLDRELVRSQRVAVIRARVVAIHGRRRQGSDERVGACPAASGWPATPMSTVGGPADS